MTQKASLLIDDGATPQPVTSFSLDVTSGTLTLHSKAHKISLTLPDLEAEACDEGHRWSRWQSYLVEATDWSYEKGYLTTRTPHQRRLCLGCGLEEDREI